MRNAAILAVLLSLAAAPALADGAVCSKLSWPLEKERALLNGPTEAVGYGAILLAATPHDKALSLELKPGAQTHLPYATGKPADPAKFAGFATFDVKTAGDYLISLSSEGWIDVVQDKASVSSTAHTGDDTCPGLRKSVRFPLKAGDVVLQISNAPADHIAVAITPAP